MHNLITRIVTAGLFATMLTAGRLSFGQEQPEESAAEQYAEPAEQQTVDNGTETVAAPAEWKTFEADAGRFQMQLPTGNWKVSNREDIQQRIGKGCIPRQVPKGLLLILENDELKAGLSVFRWDEEVVMKDEAAFDTYVSEQIKQFTSEDNGAPKVVDSSVTRINDGTYASRFVLEAEIQPGSGGCAPAQAAEGEKAVFRYIIKDLFVRPEGAGTLVLYRAMAPMKKDEVDAALPILEKALDSMNYAGETADRFFIPDAPENKLPSFSPKRERGTAWGIYILIIVGALYLWWRWQRAKRANPDFGR